LSIQADENNEKRLKVFFDRVSGKETELSVVINGVLKESE
jgi:hypothetical protein